MSAPLAPLAFLRSLATFDGWSADPALSRALEDLARRSEVWAFAEGDLVCFPDEASVAPTWVAEGCLVAAADPEEQERRYIGVREALESEGGVWVRGQTSGRFVTVPEDLWGAWLRAWPKAAAALGEPVPPPLPRALRLSPLLLEPGERPLHLFRKAPLFLFLRAALPLVFFLLFLAFGLVLQFGLAAPVPTLALWFLPGLGMAVTAFLVGLVAWEWRSSVLAVTDRSVIVRQIDVWAHRSDFEKLRLERIREAVFSRQGLTEALLRLVTLEIEGDSPKGRLLFRGLSRDSRFLTAMEALRARRQTAGPGRKEIRRVLAGRAGGAKAPRLEVPAATPVGDSPSPRTLSWRTEKEGGVWFRRHPWFALRRSLPWAGWTVLVAGLGGLAAALWPVNLGPVAALTALAALVPLGRIGWEIWDWSDDRLSIQGDRVVLVHRRPLWLGEIRQEGSLADVQQVGVRKHSLAALVLDFGSVWISLGASEPLLFEDASHPEWVQSEIFHRRSQWAKEREQEAARTRLNEVGEILETWDEARRAGYFMKETP